MNIAQILFSKPHNAHYLVRYLRFINYCEEVNESLSDDVYVEQHHICPKASDLFPEYVNFKEYPWNMIALTARQHIIAHVLLWKAYPTIASQCAAIHYICNVQNSDTIEWNQRTVPTSIYIRYAADARAKFYESRKRFATYKDMEGNSYFLHNEDPKIKELGLVGYRNGLIWSDETYNVVSKTKFLNRKIKLYMMNKTIKVKLISDDFEQYLAQGWTTELTEEDKEYCKMLKYKKSSQKLRGRTEYMLPDGTFFGKLYPTDPNIQLYGLIHYMTENKLAAARRNSVKCAEFNTGAIWYNNGTINKKFKSDPGPEWIKGSLHTDETKRLRAEGIRKSRNNSNVYNDGKRNYYFKQGEIIPECLVPGMAPQKKRAITDKNSGYSIWNDGIKNYRIKHGENVNPKWQKGMLKR